MTSFHYSANIWYNLELFRPGRILSGPRGSKLYHTGVYIRSRDDSNVVGYQLINSQHDTHQFIDLLFIGFFYEYELTHSVTTGFYTRSVLEYP